MKKFFQKTVTDYKFRRAGQGHRLDEEKPTSQPARTQSARVTPSSSSQVAGQAALARVEGEARRGGGGGGGGGRASLPGSTARFAQASAREESTGRRSSQPNYNCQESPSVQVVDTVAGMELVVCLVCPICKRSIPHAEIQDHINVCLQEEYLREPLTASVQMLHTMCKDSEKRRLCIETLCKYLDNVIGHPGEEKYQRIRSENKAFVERVKEVHGASLFLEAVGFRQELLPHQDSEQQFYVLPEEKAQDMEHLQVCRELLSSSAPLRATLDRNLTLYRPSVRVTHFDLSADFFNLSVDDIRREQKQRSEALEKEQVLRTRAMRERDDMRLAAKYYRFTLLRVRLPDGLFLQAVFRPLEKLVEVRQVVSGALTDPTLTFSLSALGQPLRDDSDTLAQLGLVPSSVINLSWVGAGPQSGHPYLEPGLLARIQSL